MGLPVGTSGACRVILQMLVHGSTAEQKPRLQADLSLCFLRIAALRSSMQLVYCTALQYHM